MAIDIGIGDLPEDRTVYTSSGITFIAKGNPANLSGILSIVYIWAETTLQGCRVGTFYGSGDIYTCRDYAEIGQVVAGAMRTFTGLSILVEAGDYIGIYFTSGELDADDAGGAGHWYKAGDQFSAGQQTYEFSDGGSLSVHGEGTSYAIPTVTTQACTSVEATTATGNGNITDTGGVNCTRRGFCYKFGISGDPTTADSVAYDDGSFPAGAYTKGLTGLSPGTSYRVRAYAVNLSGTGYGTTVQILTKPAAPTNVQATDGEHIDKVVITWAKSTGATGYQVYRDGTPLGWLGDVATYNDTGADAPTITPGAAAASDGEHTDKVALSLSGSSANNGTTHTYKVRSKNATGESSDSGTNTGYRGVGSLTYQWQRSAADSDADYSNIDGATTASYNDTGAPADGSGRYYRCVENATGANQQISAVDRGYRAAFSSGDPTRAAKLLLG